MRSEIRIRGCAFLLFPLLYIFYFPSPYLLYLQDERPVGPGVRISIQ